MSFEMASMAEINPEFIAWTGPLGLPRFERISDDDFEAAFTAGLAANLAEIDVIAGNPDNPNFDNTIEALELSGEVLTRVSSIFWNLTGAHTKEALQALERDLSPALPL